MQIWIWIDGRTTFRLSLTMGKRGENGEEEDYGLIHKDNRPLLSARDGEVNNPGISSAMEFVDMTIDRGLHGMIGKSDWREIFRDMDLTEEVAEAVFTVSKRTDEDIASLVDISLCLFLLGLEHYHPRDRIDDGSSSEGILEGSDLINGSDDVIDEDSDEMTMTGGKTRTNTIVAYVRENLSCLLDILWKATNGSVPRPTVFSSSHSASLTSLLSFCDVLFEGLVDNVRKGAESRGDRPRPLSQIVASYWAKSGRIKFTTLLEYIADCLAADPFHVDDITVKLPSPPSFPSKRTSLGAGHRRKLFVSGWNRIEVLRRPIYRDAHLRLSCNTSTSMLIQPWRSQTAIIDTVSCCSGIVLGPVSGTVVLRNVHNTLITLACRQLLIIDCSELKLSLLSPNAVIIRMSSGIELGPYNTYYEGILNEFAGSNLCLSDNYMIRIPILLDNSTFSLTQPHNFFVQPMPIEQEGEKEERQFFSSLPLNFATSWIDRLQNAIHQSSESDDPIPPNLPSRDVKYLLSKLGDDYP